MGGESITVLWTVVVTALALGGLSWFGLFRHRANQLVWASAGTAGSAAPDPGAPSDPEITRRIASLLHDDPAPYRDDPASYQDEPVPDMGSDAELADGTDPAPEARLATSAVGGALDGASPAAGVDPELALLLPVDPGEMLQRLLVDHVTGLGSRLAWDRWVADEEARERRYRRPTTLVVAEVTGLDAVSAFLGSDAAVRVVTEIADIVRSNVRTSDHAALVGPARFAMLLPETDEVRAVNFVERVRASCDRWLEANAPTVGIGFGWASPGPSGDLVAAREVADRRLAADLRDLTTGSTRP